MSIRIRNTGDYIAIYHGTYIRWQTYLNANRMWEVKLIFLVAEKKRDGAVNALHRSNNLHHSIRVHRFLSNHLICLPDYIQCPAVRIVSISVFS